MNLKALGRRLLALFQKKRLERELEDELDAHLEMAEHEAISRGMSPQEAKRWARRNFGGIEKMKEEHRDQRSIRWIEDVSLDLSYGVRSLRQAPAFSLVAISVLALGIGATSAMFSLADSVLIQPLPFPEPEQLVRVWETPNEVSQNVTTTLDFLDWKSSSQSFTALSVELDSAATLTGNGEPARISGYRVSADYFQVFGLQAALGRTFDSNEDQSAAYPVVVLSDASWRLRFGGEPEILGRSLELDGVTHQVIGVLPPSSFDRRRGEYWKPLVFTHEQRTRGFHWLPVVGRLRSEVSVAQAQEEMDAINTRQSELSPAWKRDWGVKVERYDRNLVEDDLQQSILIAFGAVTMVLLIVCANVANLLLTRGASRRKEMAVRRALGAGRTRLIAQLLTEGFVLCLSAGVLGVALASLFVQIARSVWASSLPSTADVSLDLRAVAFSGLVVLGMTLVVGLIPALQATLGSRARSFELGSRGSTQRHHTVRNLIVVGEVALSLVLICGALLLTKSLLNLHETDVGVNTENVVTMSIDLPLPAYQSEESAIQFYEETAVRVEALPGVKAASVSSDLPMREIFEGAALRIEGAEAVLNVGFKRIDPSYLGALEIPVLSGRGIEDYDNATGARALMINEELAELLASRAGMTEPIGRHVSVSTAYYVAKGGDMVEYQIVGVLKSERTTAIDLANDPVVYVPLPQAPVRTLKLVVRGHSDPLALVPGVREVVAEIDPKLALGAVQTLDAIKSDTFSGTRQPASALGMFAIVASLLTALGLYGVLSHSVLQHRREIGIRIAMGADSWTVVVQTLRTGFLMIAAGLVLGLVGSVVVTKALASLLFEVSPLDPMVLMSACAAMTVIGLLAGLLPASRAARVDPVTALREESS